MKSILIFLVLCHSFPFSNLRIVFLLFSMVWLQLFWSSFNWWWQKVSNNIWYYLLTNVRNFKMSNFSIFNVFSDRAIPSSNIDLHYAHCSRKLEKCKVCGEMIPKKLAEEHFLNTHAPVCEFRCFLILYKWEVFLTSFLLFPFHNHAEVVLSLLELKGAEIELIDNEPNLCGWAWPEVIGEI